jgi:DNA adenine methylase
MMTRNYQSFERKKVKPFLKWAGGKNQLIPAIRHAMPEQLHTLPSFTYVEPFVGSGAVFFWMMREYPNISHAIINDVNKDLINAYKTIQQHPDELTERLARLQIKYRELRTMEQQKLFYEKVRDAFNKRSTNKVLHTSRLIFLNKTCYNGLYRVNRKNQFNVPFGRYANPKICDPVKIAMVSKVLQKATILNGDYSKTLECVEGEAFFYCDPPYKPISMTSSFNSYADKEFDDEEQKRLRLFCDALTGKKINWLLSNSDVQNEYPDNNFFDELYHGYSIRRVTARRMINTDADKRGRISELLISNY